MFYHLMTQVSMMVKEAIHRCRCRFHHAYPEGICFITSWHRCHWWSRRQYTGVDAVFIMRTQKAYVLSSHDTGVINGQGGNTQLSMPFSSCVPRRHMFYHLMTQVSMMVKEAIHRCRCRFHHAYPEGICFITSWHRCQWWSRRQYTGVDAVFIMRTQKAYVLSPHDTGVNDGQGGNTQV